MIANIDTKFIKATNHANYVSYRVIRKGRLDSRTIACNSSLIPCSQSHRACLTQSVSSSLDVLAVVLVGLSRSSRILVATLRSYILTVVVFRIYCLSTDTIIQIMKNLKIERDVRNVEVFTSLIPFSSISAATSVVRSEEPVILKKKDQLHEKKTHKGAV
jgi:hypothetical protein